MKKILTIFALASVFAACKNQSSLDKTKDVVLVSDTVGAYKSNYSTDTSTMSQRNALTNGTTATGVVGATGNNTTTTRTAPVTRTRTSSARSRSYSGSTASNGTSGSNGNTAVAPARRRGWSKAAKGAVIGGVGGAVAGAIISKKKGTGAIIGGVVGAAGGYIIGRGKDKKDGRVR